MFLNYFLVAALSLLTLAIHTYFKLKYQYWKKKGANFITATAPFGSFQKSFTRTKGLAEYISDSYHSAKEKSWNCFGVYIKDRPLLIIVDLELVKNVMSKDFKHFADKGMYINEKDQPISAHLFALGGTRWKTLRAKLTPTFTSGKLRTMFQTLADCGTLLEKYMEEISGKGVAIDIKSVLGCFSTDTIGSVAFGLECKTLKEQDSPFRHYSNKIFDRRNINRLNTFLAQSFPNLARAIGIVMFPKDVEKFFTEIISETVTYREENKARRNDFLQLLIDIRTSRGNETDSSLTMNEIIAQSSMFFIAGYETSSTTMAFALYELAVHQDVQDKAKAEIQRVLKKHNDQITYDSLKEMEYLQQVIDETLRIYPPVPLLTRMCVNDYKVPGSDLTIDKGTRVIIPVKGIHHDETIYPNPSVFDPDRFAPEEKRSRDQYAHIPFGEGPRVCIGLRFGIMQTKVGLVSILKNHKVSLNERTQMPLKMCPFTFTPVVTGGIWLNIQRT